MARKPSTMDVETTEATMVQDATTASTPPAPPAPGVGSPSASPLGELPPAAAQHIEKLTAMVMEMYQVLQQFIPVVIQKIDALEQSVGMGGGGGAMPADMEGTTAGQEPPMV